ncbi:centromere-associated protein E [Polistes fuscatus]|uniref:centromere-associated protein E n=1 Tax=Polistes fuscatus TaxID=30207 RepID=UPI001CA98B6C|nr:centromere-associated protein E [Polistes fuscatus]XP_043504968.1 centromere-associated protein E [Polistes fuscatus]
MKLFSLLLLLPFFYTSLCRAREITHEDIKDAMLSLVHMMRENTEKLERHEARERQLGEQLKKAISALTKRVSAIDGMKLAKLDERLGGIEQLIAQRDERERIQMQKTADALEDLEVRLEGWLTDLETKITKAQEDSNPSLNNKEINPEILSKLNNTESLIMGHITDLEYTIKSTSLELQDTMTNQSEKVQSMAMKLEDINDNFKNVKNSVEVIKESSKSSDKHVSEQSIISLLVQEQNKALKHIEKLVKNSIEDIHELPQVNESRTLHNETESLLQETKHLIKDIIIKESNDIKDKILKSKEESKDTVESLRMAMADNSNHVSKELHDLSKGQSLMVSMADHVLDTKKRVEYGVHQILLEVGDLVKAQSKNINNTINTRFDGISNDIMDNQNGALANLTTKMEQEMNQVWRQINVMYQQMTESARALDKLHKQNEVYINGTTSTMDGMENKVSEITKRMTEVDKNLNYLLGRLLLVTQEFTQIKSGLGTALDNIKASFKEVQEKARDLSNPGPYPLPESYSELNEERTD